MPGSPVGRDKGRNAFRKALGNETRGFVTSLVALPRLFEAGSDFPIGITDYALAIGNDRAGRMSSLCRPGYDIGGAFHDRHLGRHRGDAGRSRSCRLGIVFGRVCSVSHSNPGRLPFFLSSRRPPVRNLPLGDHHDRTRDRRDRPPAASESWRSAGSGHAVRPLPRSPAQDGPASPRSPPVWAHRHVGRPPGRLPGGGPAFPRVRGLPDRAVLYLAAVPDGAAARRCASPQPGRGDARCRAGGLALPRPAAGGLVRVAGAAPAGRPDVAHTGRRSGGDAASAARGAAAAWTPSTARWSCCVTSRN